MILAFLPSGLTGNLMNLALDIYPEPEPRQKRGSAYACIPPGKPESEDLLAGLYAPVVEYWSRKAVPDRYRDLDDIRQDALIGLIYAYRSYDPGRGAKFKTWAVYMVRLWALYDGLRFNDSNLRNAWLRDRVAHKNIKNMLSLDRFIEDWKGGDAPVFKDPGAEGGFDLPDAMFEAMVGLIADGRIRFVIDEYYLKSRTLGDIGLELGISRERVRQLLEKAYAILRKKLSRQGLIKTATLAGTRDRRA